MSLGSIHIPGRLRLNLKDKQLFSVTLRYNTEFMGTFSILVLKAELVLMFQRFTIICFCVIRGSEGGGGGRGLGPPPSENSNLLKFTNFDRLS